MIKKPILSVLIGSACVLLLSGAAVVSATGEPYYTGSPSDGATCTSCHTQLGTAATTATISASPAFGGSGTALTYVPGTTYTLTVKEGGYSFFGFDLEIMNSNSATATTNSGTMTAISTTNCKVFGNGPTNITHKAAIASTSSATIKWVAPASGTAYLYAAVLGVNNNGTETGDKVKNISYTLTPNTSGIASHEADNANLTLFPNPATDNLRISYSLTERGNVSVRLYNLNGEFMGDLLQETQERGIQTAETHLPAGLAKGFYLVKLTINGRQSTQKLLIY